MLNVEYLKVPGKVKKITSFKNKYIFTLYDIYTGLKM